jgi:hypothetical protein
MKILYILFTEAYTFFNEAGEALNQSVEVKRKMCIHENNVHYVKQGGPGAFFCKATPELIKLAK